MSEGINLLKPEMARGPGGAGKKSLIPLYVTIAILVIEVLVWGWFWYSGRSVDGEAEAATSRIADLDLQISKSKDELKEAIGYQSRLANLGTLLKGHIFWSKAFEELSDYTFKNVRYESFIGDTKNSKISVAGTASSYMDIAKLILGLKQSKKFAQVTFRSEGESSGEKTGFGFTLEIVFDPRLIKPE